MKHTVLSRRSFLSLSAAAAAAGAWRHSAPGACAAASAPAKPFQISLAEWSLNKTIRAGKLDNLDFPLVAKRDFGIECVEFVDQFFSDKSADTKYLDELKRRADGEGVDLGLIMLDTNGPLGHPTPRNRNRAIQKTCIWVDAAARLGCRTVRINARGPNDPGELAKNMAESCAKIADYAKPAGINLVIENHGGPSSDPVWLTDLMRTVGKPNFGTLPDFGNFPEEIDRYDAVEMMMPYAKAVSAKATSFTPEGLCAETDFHRMMRIVRDGGYAGYVGIESGSPEQEGEADAIGKTKAILLDIRAQQRRCQPLFNGKDLSGWAVVEGGEWTVEDGVLIGRNGRDWSTNPEKTGSWLRTEKMYGDFRLELQYTVNERGNSGVFFRSGLEKNPAFTGYEMQIFDAPEAPASKHSPSSLYDTAAPTENRVRPAGEWNTVTIIAEGPRIRIVMNGTQVMDTKLERSMKGYIGLQNHDERSVVKFRNIRLEEL